MRTKLGKKPYDGEMLRPKALRRRIGANKTFTAEIRTAWDLYGGCLVMFGSDVGSILRQWKVGSLRDGDELSLRRRFQGLGAVTAEK